MTIKEKDIYSFFLKLIKVKEAKRDKYSLSVDYSDKYDKKYFIEFILNNYESINDFLVDLNNAKWKEFFENEKDFNNFKSSSFEKLLYLFKDDELITIFEKIDVINFNFNKYFIYLNCPGFILKTSKKLSTVFSDKKDIEKEFFDLRKFFDLCFYQNFLIKSYGTYSKSEKFDKDKIELFIEKEIISKELVNEISNNNNKSYFQKSYYNKDYVGVISYKLFQEYV